MKKFSILLVILLAVVSVSPILTRAESEPVTDRPVRSDFEAKRVEIQEKIKENKEKIKESREDVRKDINKIDREVKKETKDDVREIKRDAKGKLESDIAGAKVRARVAIRVLEATIVRLEGLTTRIESRVTKIGQSGASTTDATAFINAAKTNIKNAKDHIAILKSVDISIGTSTATSTNATSTNATSTATSTLKISFDKIKAEAKIAREELVKAKQNLMRALTSIKKVENLIRKDDNDDDSDSSATSTNATSTATTTQQ